MKIEQRYGGYENFTRDLESEGLHFCWACGRGPDKPVACWFSDWWIQRAHLAAGGSMFRAHDRRVINALCPRCHSACVTDSAMAPVCNGRPSIDYGMMLWIKEIMDSDHYDPEYIKQCWRKNVPAPKPLREVYRAEFIQNRSAGHADFVALLKGHLRRQAPTE